MTDTLISIDALVRVCLAIGYPPNVSKELTDDERLRFYEALIQADPRKAYVLGAENNDSMLAEMAREPFVQKDPVEAFHYALEIAYLLSGDSILETRAAQEIAKKGDGVNPEMAYHAAHTLGDEELKARARDRLLKERGPQETYRLAARRFRDEVLMEKAGAALLDRDANMAYSEAIEFLDIKLLRKAVPVLQQQGKHNLVYCAAQRLGDTLLIEATLELFAQTDPRGAYELGRMNTDTPLIEKAQEALLAQNPAKAYQYAKMANDAPFLQHARDALAQKEGIEPARLRELYIQF